MNTWLQTIIDAAQSMSPWEAAAVILAIAYLLLAVRENILCWLFAFISTAIYTVLFWDVNLLMDSALNVYYMAMAIYGWYQWGHGGTNGDEQAQALAVRSMSGQQHFLVITAIAILSLSSGYLLAEYSTAAWPYVDSFTTWGAIVTTWMVARKIIQNWHYWFIIDSVSVYLYVSRGLWLTALLFVLYLVLIVIGYREWRKSMDADCV